MYVWLVGQYMDEQPWGVQGVFDSEERAVNACRDRNYWIARLRLNAVAPHGRKPWPKSANFRYPLAPVAEGGG